MAESATPPSGEKILAADAPASTAVLLPTKPAYPAPPPALPQTTLSPPHWGMIAFLISEVAFFSTLIVTYITFIGRDGQPGGLGGPTPADALSLPLVIGTTLCLLSSSVTIHMAERALRHGHGATFAQLWGATIALGVIFLLGTAYEWTELIGRYRLTISRNLFGTTYYTLVGFHAAHVTIGVIVLVIVLALALRGRLSQRHSTGIELTSWYWHFVDVVWVVVFTLVYVVAR